MTLPVRRRTSPAPVFLSEKRHADGAVHAAGCDKCCPEWFFLHQMNGKGFILLNPGGLIQYPERSIIILTGNPGCREPGTPPKIFCTYATPPFSLTLTAGNFTG